MHRVECGGSEIRDTQRANSLVLVWTAAPRWLSFGPSKTMGRKQKREQADCNILRF